MNSIVSIITGLALGYQGGAISGDGTAHVSVTGITTATRQGGGLVCVDTSRDTGTATGISLNWYQDGNKLQRQTSSSFQSFLGFSTYLEFNVNKMIWLKRDEDTMAIEGVFFCRLGRRDKFEATVSVGVYYPSECGYFLHNFNKCIHIHLSPEVSWSIDICQRKCVSLLHACCIKSV